MNPKWFELRSHIEPRTHLGDTSWETQLAASITKEDCFTQQSENTCTLAAPLWRRCWSKGNTSLTAAATGSQCTKWKQVPLSRHEKAGCSSPATRPRRKSSRSEAGLGPSRSDSVLAQLFSSIHELTGALTQGTQTAPSPRNFNLGY